MLIALIIENSIIIALKNNYTIKDNYILLSFATIYYFEFFVN